MSQRFCLFYAGYTASAPSLYFNKVVLLNSYLQEYQESTWLKNLSQQLSDESYTTDADIKTALSSADYFKLEVMPQPSVPDAYFNWLKDYIAVFEEQFPLTRIEHYYFFYARKIAEMLLHLGMVHTL